MAREIDEILGRLSAAKGFVAQPRKRGVKNKKGEYTSSYNSEGYLKSERFRDDGTPFESIDALIARYTYDDDSLVNKVVAERPFVQSAYKQREEKAKIKRKYLDVPTPLKGMKKEPTIADKQRQASVEERLAQREAKDTGVPQDPNEVYVRPQLGAPVRNVSAMPKPQTLGSYMREYAVEDRLNQRERKEAVNPQRGLGRIVGEGAKAIGISVPKGALSYLSNWGDNVWATVQQAERFGKDVVSGDIPKQVGALIKQETKEQWQMLKESGWNPSTFSARSEEAFKKLRQINANKRLDIQVKGSEDSIFQGMRFGGKQLYQKPLDVMTQAQRLDQQSKGVQSIAGAVESLPYSVAAMAGPVGFVFNYASNAQANIIDKYAQMEASGQKITPEVSNGMFVYSAGSAIVEAGSEAIYPFMGKLAGASGAKLLQQPSINLWKSVFQGGSQEAMEEVYSIYGQGIIAKITTDPNTPIYGVNAGEGLITLEELGMATYGAFVMGGVASAMGDYKGFNNTKKELERLSKKPPVKYTAQDLKDVQDAIVKDSKIPENKEEVQQKTTEAVVVAQDMQTDEQKIDNVDAVIATQKEQLGRLEDPEEIIAVQEYINELEQGKKEIVQPEPILKRKRTPKAKTQEQTQEATPSPATAPTTASSEQVASTPIQTATEPIASAQTQETAIDKTKPYGMELSEYISQNKTSSPKGSKTYSATTERVETERLANEWVKSVEQAYIDGIPALNKPAWAMTVEEYAKASDDELDASIRSAHEQVVRQAIKDGKPVPANVREQYPARPEPTPEPISEPTPKKANKKPKSKGLLLKEKARYEKRLENPQNDWDRKDIEYQLKKISKELAKIDKAENPVEPKKEDPKKGTRQYYSLLRGKDGKPIATKVDGTPIRLDAMPRHEFFIRNQLEGKTKSWTIVDANSGLAVAVGLKTKKEAIESANNAINRVGVAGIETRIAGSIEKFGAMPFETVAVVSDESKIESKEKANKKPTQTVEQADEAARKALAEEAQAQDTSGQVGIVAPAFRNAIKQPTKYLFETAESQDTKESIDKASTPIQKAGINATFKDVHAWLQKWLGRGSVNVPVEFGDIRRAWRLTRTSFLQASQKADQLVAQVYNKVDKSQLFLLKRAILYLDMEENIQRGLWDNRKSMSNFNIKNKQEALTIIKAIKQDLAKPENKIVVEAIDARRKLMDAVRDQVIARASRAGFDYSHIKSRLNYMYNAVLEYQKEFNENKENMAPRKRVAYEQRLGTVQDYISDPIMADYLILNKMYKDMRKLDLYYEIKQKNDPSKVRIVNGQQEFEEGWAEFNPGILGMTEYDHQDQALKLKLKMLQLDKLKIAHDSKTGKRALASAARSAKQEMLTVPKSIVDAATSEFMYKKDKVASKAFDSVERAWKYSVIRMPHAVIRYNIRNAFGDLDAVFAGRPSAIKYVPKAMYDLFKFYWRGGSQSAELSEYVDRQGLTTGQSVVELNRLDKTRLGKFYEMKKSPKTVPEKVAKKIWKIATLETATEYREQILRYAAYLSFAEELKKSKNNLPSYYTASIPAEIKSISDYRDRAAKMANDLLGAYDDTSLAGQTIARYLMPFFRFKETNIKRYYRMAKNTFYQDPDVLISAGTNMASRIGRSGRVGGMGLLRMGKLAFGISAMQIALDLINRASDEEDELSEQARSTPHIIVPKWVTGSNRNYYIDRLGSYSDLLMMAGIDGNFGTDIIDVISGKVSFNDKLKEIALEYAKNEPGKAIVNEMFNASMPLPKTAFALIPGINTYPDVFNPTQIEDRWAYAFGLVGLDDLYKDIVDLPIVEGSLSKQQANILLSSTIAGDTAVWEIRDLIEEYNDANDIVNGNYSSPGSEENDKTARKRSKAAYNYKVSIKLNDKVAAKKWLAEYVMAGGTQKGFEASLRTMYPGYNMKKEDKEKFLKSLTPDQKKTYKEAYEFVDSLVAKIKRESAGAIPEK